MLLLTVALVCTANEVHAQRGAQPSIAPKNGFVPDSMTAIRIAEAVLTPVWGAKKVRAERPFAAVLQDSVWHVTSVGAAPLPPGRLSFRGYYLVDIVRTDGRVIRVWRIR